VKRIDAVSENRGDFVKAAIEEKLNPAKVEVPELTDREKRGVLKDAKKLSELLNDAMLRRMEMEQDLLDNMPRDDFLKLVAGRLPKFDIGDPELEQEV
jgi:hypothetical protein